MHDIVVIGASSGGLAALKKLVADLPADLPAALFVVMHTSPEAAPVLHHILDRAGPLPVLMAEDGMAVENSRVLVAPPDHHVLLNGGRVQVVRGPRENRHRPSIDPLFRSAAWQYGPRVVAVVLTGRLDDGAAGLWAVKSCGGTTVAQEPTDAEYPQMPMAALASGSVDLRLPLEAIAPELARLAMLPAREPAAAGHGARPADVAQETKVATETGPHDPQALMAGLGPPSPFTCPGCGGALWELDAEGALHYRCHTGHAFSAGSLLEGQSEQIEESLYSALRAVQEKGASLQRLAERWPDDLPAVKAEYLQRSRQLERTAEVLRALLAGVPAG